MFPLCQVYKIALTLTKNNLICMYRRVVLCVDKFLNYILRNSSSREYWWLFNPLMNKDRLTRACQWCVYTYIYRSRISLSVLIIGYNARPNSKRRLSRCGATHDGSPMSCNFSGTRTLYSLFPARLIFFSRLYPERKCCVVIIIYIWAVFPLLVGPRKKIRVAWAAHIYEL